MLYELHGGDGYDTLRVAVRSNEMRHDFYFIVGFVGLYLNVSYVAGAKLIMEPPSIVAKVAREFVFVPEVGASSFAFNVGGLQAQPSFLACSSVTGPSPPVPGATYSYDENLDASIPATATRSKLQLRSQDTKQAATLETTSDLVVVGLMLILLGGAGGLVWYCRNQGSGSRGQRVGLTGIATMDEVSVNHDNTIAVELTDAAHAPNNPMQSWCVRLELDGDDPYTTYLPHAMASDPIELKHALLEACVSNLGPDVIPTSWLNGRIDLMAVQFIGAQGGAMTMTKNTEMADVQQSDMLRVTERSGVNG